MEFNAADIFEGVVDRVPDREAIVHGSTRLTYKELDARSNKAANALKKLGIKKGSHIGIYAFNCVEWLEIMLGAYKLCAIPININYRYVEEELKYLIDNADMEAIFYHKQFSNKLENIKSHLPLLKDFICIEDDSGEDDVIDKSFNFEDLIANEDESRLDVDRSGDDKYILYTGGTTGMPKGVVWRMEDVLMTLGGGIDAVTGEKYPTPEAFADKCLQDQTIALALAPFMHGGAQWQSFNSFFSGWKLIINDQVSFDADYVWEVVAKEKVMNLTIMGDAMGRPLCDALPRAIEKGLDLSSLFVLSSTASVFSASIKDTILEYLPNLFLIDAVGSSETGATGVNIHTKDGKLKDSGGGPKFTKPNFSEILNLDTKEVIPPSDTETIGYLARKGHVPVAYYKDEEKSKKTFIEVGGVRYSIPGDMAKYEEDGQMTLLGRGSVSINSGGEKIFPEEVEMALKAHPNIFDCLVVGVKDDRWGQKVVAVIQRRENDELSLDDIKDVASKYIASYKMPKEIVFSELIERAPSGKPNYQWAQEFANSKLEIK
ncbi:MAG: acyl-CoA synthetase [Gammaproteobacteria bacterium]|jgi:acyl-CoA synthetase (AMP-forming)/AMP-acid ligase II|nr:acyl-CoA synthetase [Gammaproteobacteria bacterium]|tara:strand:+ start:1527 stop:3161 length:1635 start_codon:yes stop_codon:yes gene_type:complete